MNELRIIRGRDIGAFIDGAPLFGLTMFSAKEIRGYHAVREFLNSEPVERIAQGTAYEIKLELMTMFGAQIPSSRPFTLSFVENDEEFIYSGCRVGEVSQTAQGNKIVSQVYSVTADDFTRRVIDDE